MTNRFVFLDIDGVMKPGRSYFCEKRTADHNGGFDPLAVAAVNRLCRLTGASIVFNTTWNRLNMIDIADAQGITAPIAGKTKYPYYDSRLKAINDWLSEHPAEEWVALDDCQIDHERALLVCPENGISAQNYRDACRLLGKPDAFMLLL
jgi:hypothetical protein